MPAPRLLAVMFALAILGGAIGSLITLALTDQGEEERGMIVRLGVPPWWDEEPVYCNHHHRFCIPSVEDIEDARAFYLGDPNPYFREQGCTVDWRPDFDISGFDLPPGESDTGAFRGGCSGSTFLRDGTRIFGPAPRDLDEFPLAVVRATVEGSDGPIEIELLEVDTRTLICGEYAAGETDDGCKLAPPYD